MQDVFQKTFFQFELFHLFLVNCNNLGNYRVTFFFLGAKCEESILVFTDRTNQFWRNPLLLLSL